MRYEQPVIYMTENGSASDEPGLETAMHNYEPRNYFKHYIQACAEAMDAGVDL
jgi:beta-glucosidase